MFSPPTFKAKVITFQEWPQENFSAAPATYAFSRQPDQESLEYSAYENMLRSGLDYAGLTEIPLDEQPRFIVYFFIRYGEKQQLVSVPVYRYYPDPFFGYYGPWHWPYGMHSYGMYPQYVGDRIVPQNYLYARLTIVIRDTHNLNAQGSPRSVYETTAITQSDEMTMLELFPLMVQAAFSSFPAENGSERIVSLPIKSR